LGVVTVSDLKEACAASYEQAQTLRRATKLTLARAQLAACQQTCPAPLAQDCRTWTAEIDREMPAIVIMAVDRGGHPISKFTFDVDGESRDAPASPATVALDPGRHRVVVQVGDERHSTDLKLATGERRDLKVTFTAVEPVIPPHSRPAIKSSGAIRPDRAENARVPPAAWALGAIGVIGLGTGAVLGLKGQVDRNELRSRCAPTCGQDEVDAIGREWRIAAIAAAVGAVATGAAIWLVVDANRDSRVGVHATGDGAIGMIGGRF
jgi:hypothetical protein